MENSPSRIPTQHTYGGLPHLTARASFFVSEIFAKEKGNRILWLVKNSGEKDALLSHLRFFASLDHGDLPLVEPINWTAAYAFSTKTAGIFVVTLEELTHTSLPDASHWNEYSLDIAEGTFCAPGAFMKKLIEWGYERNNSANAPGVFARRGGIVDIFPSSTPSPLRIEWSGDTITSLKNLDDGTQRGKVTLLPFHLSETVLRRSWLDMLSSLRSNDDMSTWRLLLSDPEEFSEYDSWPRIQQCFRGVSGYTFATFPLPSHEKVFRFDAPPSFHGNFPEMQSVLSEMERNGYHIIITSAEEEKMRKILQGFHKLDVVTDYPSAESFLWTDEKVLFLTDLEIFGEKIKRTLHKRVRKSVDWTEELTYGDFIVHLDHGIARFRGTTHAEVSGVRKEYFSLEYAENDRLLVPVDMAHKIEKYVGASHPKLHRLSGGGWYQLTQKVKKDTLRTARELLELYAARETAEAPVCLRESPEEAAIRASFPFEETPDQRRVIAEVLHDLRKSKPTDRLICGDVGFGKTEVALRASARAVMNGLQVALLCPTTILAQQHFDTFQERLSSSSAISVSMLSRFQSKKEQRVILAKLKNHTTDIVIGTHRLLQKDISFKKLGLLIIDEEQRFGVKDKERLKSLRHDVHVMTLTATPIPRTLHLALSGLREISLMTTPPEGRLPITTVIAPYDEGMIQKAIRDELKRGGQVYFLHNHVETIEAAAQGLAQLVPEAKFGIAHGQMEEKELVHAMSQFDRSEVNVLVCSTIIENGLDLPNANTLIVDHASDFGLGQLYQLRGRVGRSFRQAHAYFFYRSHSLSDEAKKRLRALKEANTLGSGWQLAKRDLEIRGAGDILSHNQHGKVAAVGLHLYMRLLQQTIEEIRTGKKPADIRDVSIDLPLDVSLPKKGVWTESERLKMYQELANITELRELEAYRKDLMIVAASRREKELMLNLLFIFRLRIVAQKTNIIAIDTEYRGPEKQTHIIVKFLTEPAAAKIYAFLEKHSSWLWKGTTLSIALEEMGSDWKKTLEDTVKFFQQP